MMNKIHSIENAVNNLRGLDKKQTLFDTKRAGLVLIANKQKIDPKTGKDITKKSWYFNYRPNGFEPVRIFLGHADRISKSAAITHIKKIESNILNNKKIF